ncbi:MAG TPA: GNAT family N-acetyltransferase [Hyphomicrobiales bacterium]|nr:GNAT family N-acetyltransferase [Hyphomicrobiales bacterium]
MTVSPCRKESPLESRYAIRPLQGDEVSLLLSWADEEGWNPGLDDARAFHAADPDGFLVGELDGEPIAGISAVNYGGRYGFVGLYLVKPAWRGQGYGLALWQAAMDRLGTVACGLDGVPAQVENYRRSGFTYAYRQLRFAGPGGSDCGYVGAGIAPLQAEQLPALLAYDAAVFGVAREAFLHAWLSMPGSAVFVAGDAGRIEGYAVLRPCRDGHKIGPLFADDPATAQALFLACRGRAGAGPVFLDVSEANGEAVQLAQRQGLSVVFETARMYRNGQPEFPVQRVYGVTSFELG